MKAKLAILVIAACFAGSAFAKIGDTEAKWLTRFPGARLVARDTYKGHKRMAVQFRDGGQVVGVFVNNSCEIQTSLTPYNKSREPSPSDVQKVADQYGGHLDSWEFLSPTENYKQWVRPDRQLEIVVQKEQDGRWSLSTIAGTMRAEITGNSSANLAQNSPLPADTVGKVPQEPTTTADSPDDLFKRADADLTSAYRGCLAAFPKQSKEQLRIAQRAWIVFSDKDEAAAELAGRRRGLTADDLDREGLNEVYARAEQLKSFFQLPNQDLESCKRDLQQTEQELTVAYQAALNALAPDEQQKLRDAQRSWIEYREKNSRAHIAEPTGRAPIWAVVTLNRRRTQELQNFYLGRLVQSSQSSQQLQAQGTVSATSTPFVMLAQPQASAATVPEATIQQMQADPGVRAKMIAEFKDETKALLADVSGETSSFKRFTSFTGVPTISSSLSDRISNMAQKAHDLRSNVGNGEALRECGAETATLDALACLDRAVHAIKSGDAPSASFTVTAFLNEHSHGLTEEQKALWQAIESLRTLCDQSSKEAATHVERAESLANSGKPAEAVKEYEAANSIFPDSKIGRSVKKLREASLGL